MELSCHVASTLDLRPVLGLILEYVERMIGYTSASIWKYDGNQLVLLDHRGTLPQEQGPQDAIARPELPGDREAIQYRQPVIIGDLLGDREPARAYREAIGQRLLGPSVCSRSWMGVPLIIEDRGIGMLHLDHQLPDYFTPHHAQLAMIIANQAAVAIQNAARYEDAQRVAVLNERARLARDLHDSIIQAVYGMMWNMRSAHEIVLSDANRADKLVVQALNTARTCLLDLRSLIFELRPELLEQYGLAGLLARHIESVQTGFPVDISLEIDGEPELPLRAKETLYRIAQEALQNAVKHSQAQQVRLRLQQVLNEIFLEVQDDGVGFDPNTPSAGQFGLLSMRERAAQLGGKLEIISSRGRGTQVQILIPVQPVRPAA